MPRTLSDEPIFNKIEEIPYKFLKETATKLKEKYPLRNIYMDKRRELCITFNAKFSDDTIKDILVAVHPKDISKTDIELDYNLNYSFSDDMQKTYIYSADGIDYSTI